MKIVMVTHYFDSHRGGIEIVAGNLYRELASLGEELVWLASSSLPPADIGRSRAILLPAWNVVEKKIGLPFPIPTLAALHKITQELSTADVALFHDCLYLTNIASFIIAKLQRIPVIVVQHTTPNERHIFQVLMKGATAALTRPMLSKAEQAVFISQRTKHFYSSVCFKRPPQIIFNGVDTDVFVPERDGELRTNMREEFGLPHDRPVILFVGRFVAKKGLHILKQMINMSPSLFWAFAGGGPLDPNHWGAANVRVISGLRGRSLAKLYRASDALVLPSVQEGFPLVVQEALASGLPVVCAEDTVAADPAMARFVKGVPVNLKDEGQTAKNFLAEINDVLASQNLDGQLPGLRSAFAMSRYSWRGAAERYLSIASGLIRKPAPEAQELRSDNVLQ